MCGDGLLTSHSLLYIYIQAYQLPHHVPREVCRLCRDYRRDYRWITRTAIAASPAEPTLAPVLPGLHLVHLLTLVGSAISILHTRSLQRWPFRSASWKKPSADYTMRR
jgi:hypothetical protein